MIGNTSKIFVVDDEELVRLSLSEDLRAAGYQVLTAESGEKALEIYPKEHPDLTILDLWLPKMSGLEVLKRIHEINGSSPVLMLTAHGSMESAIEAMRLGAYDYITKPFDLEEVRHAVARALETEKLKAKVGWLLAEHKKHHNCDQVIATTPGMKQVMSMVERVAMSDAPTVLLQGESGTGKDLLARAIHLKSRRADEPFLEINCASIPETLIETELFGHERGSFTDAKTMKRGLFEAARNGTVFLDEIGDMSIHTQAKLLQAIENRRFRRVGGLEDIETNAQVIAATNVDLKKAVQEKRFREDLYFRLQLIPIHIPPLRDRPEEITLMAAHFIKKFNQEYRKNIKGISPEAEALMKAYPWPGNVRELKNVIERIAILENEIHIRKEHLPPEIQSGAPGLKPPNDFEMPAAGINLEKVEKDFLLQALQKTHGNQTHAAQLLGITRHTLRYRMEKFGLLEPRPQHHAPHPV